MSHGLSHAPSHAVGPSIGRALLGLVGLLLCPAASAGAPANAWGHAPTRLQMCQEEFKGAEGEARKRQLRECLVRRADGEHAVADQCRSQLRVGGKPSAAQHRQLRDCELRALAVPSGQLPRRPAPPPEPPAAVPAQAGTEPSIPGFRNQPPRRWAPPVSVREGA